MMYLRKMQLISLLVGLVLGSGLMAVWWPVSAGVVTEAYTQYLPFVPVVNCVPGPPVPPDDQERDNAVEVRINDVRGEHGLPPLTNSQKITQAALRHSNDMADNNFFSHAGSDGSRAGDRLNDACYNWQAYGEIIAAGFRTPTRVVAAWMGSPGHKGIILHDEFEEFGAGYAYNGSTLLKHYWTVDFGLLATGKLTGVGDIYECKEHAETSDGEIWLSLYSLEPCEQILERFSGLNEQR